MIWRSAKALLGWYAARTGGPRMVSPGLGSSGGGQGKIASDADHMRIAGILGTCTPGTRRAILAWATMPDEAAVMGPMSRAELRRVCQALERAGLLEPRVRPVETESVEFVDLETGDVVRMRRTKR